MKSLFSIALIMFCQVIFAQEKYSNCTAAFLDSKMIVSKYEPLAKAFIQKSAIGELTVCTADISQKETKAMDKVLFSIAIKDGNTGTLVLISKKPILKYNLSTILDQCKIGDSIVLLVNNDGYALPHNEIRVQ